MKTLCFLNNKGGVGKTATVTTVGHILSSVYKKRVLLVDMDPQHNTSARFSNFEWAKIFISIYKNEPEEINGKTVEDILLNSDMDPHEAIKKTKYQNLDIIPAYLTLSSCEELIKANVSEPQQFKLRIQLEKIQDEYDYCLIDCSPSINILNVNALAAADEVYMPVRTDGDSCIGMAISMNLMKTVQKYNHNLRLGGVFITQCNWQEGVAKTTYELLSQLLPKDMLIPIQIGSSKYLKENSFEQMPLLEADNGKRKSAVTKAYLLLTEYIMAANKEIFIAENRDKLAELKHFSEK